jgi:hypothetical protein
MPSRPAARPRKSDSTVIELPIATKTDKGTASTSVKAQVKTEAKVADKPAKAKSTGRAASKEAAPKGKVATSQVAEKPAPPMESPRAEAPAPKVEPPVAEKPLADKPAKRPSALQASPAAEIQVSAEERQRLVAEAAYYIAERRGFATGYEHEDWLAAEAEVEQRLKGGNGNK